jgi:uncharacterized protein YjbJ (UPF0337 family)
MDKDRVKGPAKEGIGKVKEGWGDATNDPDAQAEGEADQAEGKLQNTWGETKDKAREVFDDDKR